MFCINCGNKIEENTKFCPKCGNPVEQSEKKENLPSVKKEEVKTQPEKKKIPIPTINMNMDINKVLTIAIVLVGVIVLGFIGSAIYKSTQSRTIMIYMIGSNLEEEHGLATRDLKDIDYNITSKNKVTIYLMPGGTKLWKNDFVSTEETSIFKLTKNGFEKVEKRPRTNMGEAKNLSYFLEYCYKNSKTSKYDLIFYNHGGAVDGSDYDDFYPKLYSKDHIDVKEYTEALANSPFAKKKLELVSFRTCLNATVEVANSFKKYAKYMVASEEETMGHPYDSAFRYINELKPSDNAIDYGRKQTENYRSFVSNYCNLFSGSKKENLCITVTHSVTDLSKIDNFNKSFDKFAKDLKIKLSDTSNFNDMSKIRSNLKQYASEEPSFDMVDLMDFTAKYGKYSKYGNEVKNAFKKLVIYNFSNTDYSHGLSLYSPYNNKVYAKGTYYNDISISQNYTDFALTFYDMKEGKKSGSFSTLSSNKAKTKKEKKDEASFEMDLTKEQADNFAKAQYMVFVDTKDGNHQLLYVGNKVELDGTKLKAHVQGKLLRMADIEYDDINCWITAVEKSVTDEYTEVYASAILYRGLFWKSEVVTITIRIDDEHPNGYITSVISTKNDKDDDEQNFSVFSPSGLNMNDYTYIIMANQRYKITDNNGEFTIDFSKQGNGVYRGLEIPVNQFRFIKEDFDSEYDYYGVFRVYDTANQQYFSKLIKIK